MRKLLIAATVAALAGGSLAAQAHNEGDIILRVGVTTVAPNDDSDRITLPTEPPTVLRGVEVDDDTQLGLIPVWMITDDWGLELLAATPFEHDIDIAGTGLAAGSTKHLPPTLSLQWYPRGGQDGWQPYIGAGLNYTYFFDEDTKGPLSDADLDLDDSWGIAYQLGFDIAFSERWVGNIDFRYISIEPDAEVNGEGIGDVEIDPFIASVMIGYRFGR